MPDIELSREFWRQNPSKIRQGILRSPEAEKFIHRENFLSAIENIATDKAKANCLRVQSVFTELSLKPFRAFRDFFGEVDTLTESQQSCREYNVRAELLLPANPNKLNRTLDFLSPFGSQEFVAANLKNIRQSLEIWADEFNINQLWIIRRAFDTLKFWHKRKTANRLRFYGFSNYSNFSEGKHLDATLNRIAPPKVELPEYYPSKETREHYIQATMEMIKQDLETYADERENYYLSSGYKRNEGRNFENLNYEWIVLWTVGKWKEREIAEKYNVTPSAIKQVKIRYKNYLPVRKG